MIVKAVLFLMVLQPMTSPSADGTGVKLWLEVKTQSFANFGSMNACRSAERHIVEPLAAKGLLVASSCEPFDVAELQVEPKKQEKPKPIIPKGSPL